LDVVEVEDVGEVLEAGFDVVVDDVDELDAGFEVAGEDDHMNGLVLPEYFEASGSGGR
jgi:hypothetical protein